MVTRRGIEVRFQPITERHGPVLADQCMSFPRSVQCQSCVDHEGLRKSAEWWLAGGPYHPKQRMRMPSPAEVLRKCPFSGRLGWDAR